MRPPVRTAPATTELSRAPTVTRPPAAGCTLTASDVQAWVAETLANFKVPAYVDFTNEKQDSDRLQQWLESLDPDEMGKYKM